MLAAQRSSPQALHHGADVGQFDDRDSNLRLLAARRVQSLGTTAKCEEWQRNSEWCADLEYVWRNRTEAQRIALEKRARRLKRDADSTVNSQLPPPCPLTAFEVVKWRRSSEWASNRARAIAMPRSDIVDTCRTRWRTVRCDCGPRELQVGCDNTLLCSWCRKRHWRKWRRKITRSLDAHVRAARASWYAHGRRGMLPGVYLITLTAPHSGDLVTDRKRMQVAVKQLCDYAVASRWWSSYVLTWEVTAGTQQDGHLHCHMAVVSSWVPYTSQQADGLRGLHEAWRKAMPGARVLDVQAPNRKRKHAASAADYLAKYVTKGIDPSEMTGRKAGEMLVAFRNRRKVSTSRHFWLKEHRECKTCGCYHRMIEAPCSIQVVAPGAVLSAHAERLRWFVPRGDPQVALRWDTT